MGTKSNLEISIKILEPEVHKTDSTDTGFSLVFNNILVSRYWTLKFMRLILLILILSLVYKNQDIRA